MLARWLPCLARSSHSGAASFQFPTRWAPTRAWLGALRAALGPYDAGTYLNFAEERLEMTKAFLPETVDRLREVKRRYDPEDLFKSNHPVTG
jgi:Berberine and berberine like